MSYTGQAFNHLTIIEDGSGQISGNAAEKFFGSELHNNKITHKWVGAEKASWDFEVGLGDKDLLIDLKALDRNTYAVPDYNHLIPTYVEGRECDLYVAASVCEGHVQLMGWCTPQEYWSHAERKKKGVMVDGCRLQADSGVIRYNRLRPMDQLFAFIKERK